MSSADDDLSDARTASSTHESHDDDDETSTDEYEPQLKYQRLVGSLPDIFNQENNTATALCVSDKLIILGTNLGFLYVLNFEGYCDELKFRPHVGAVRDVSIDSTGEFVASCSDDGKIVIRNLYEAANSQHQKGAAIKSDNLDFLLKGGVSSVQIDPEFGRRAERAVVCGGRPGRLILMKKGWFGHKETIIHKNEGPIYAIKWFKNLIAWGNEQGVKIFDVLGNEKVSFVPRPRGSENKGTCRCNLQWYETPKGEDRLIIGWGTSVAVLSIKDRVTTPVSPMLPKDVKVPSKAVEILTMFEVDFLICGVQPYGDDQLLLLAYDPSIDSDEEEEDEEGGTPQIPTAPRPELRILDMKGEELSCDALSIKNFEHYSVHDYRLEYCQIDNAYYILSQRDIVVAKPRDVDDHIQWLLSKEQFMEALKYAQEQAKTGVQMKPEYSPQNIGSKYISWLLGREEWEKAASYVPQVAGTDVTEWERWVWAFVQKKKFDCIVPYIPYPNRQSADTPMTPILTGFDFEELTQSNPASLPSFRGGIDGGVDLSQVRLDDTIYEMLLNHYLMTSAPLLLKTIQQMPKDLYKAQSIITAVVEQLKKEHSQQKQDNHQVSDEEQVRRVALLNTLAHLYTSEQKYEKTLDIYLQLRQTPERVFQFIEKHELFSQIQDKVTLLLKLDEARALDLLMTHVEQIQVDKVVRQLKDDRKLLHIYLDALFNKHSNKSSKFHLLQVELYAEFDTDNLPWFLEQSQNYDIEKALAICEQFLDHCEEDIAALKSEIGNSTDMTHPRRQELAAEEKHRSLLYKSIVYLLGRMGNTKLALNLIIEKLQDVNLAIEFVDKQKDAELWHDLVQCSLKNGQFIAGLLDHMADYSHEAMDHMDPMSLIQSIPDQMVIPELKYKLTNIISDYSLQLTLQRGCQQVLDTDTRSLSQMLHKQQRKAVKVSAVKRCVVCGNHLRTTSKDHNLVFMCGHAYHVSCFTVVQENEQRKEKNGKADADKSTASSSASPSLTSDDVDPVTGRTASVSALEYRHRLEESQGEYGVRCILCHQKDREKDRKQAALRSKRKNQE